VSGPCGGSRQKVGGVSGRSRSIGREARAARSSLSPRPRPARPRQRLALAHAPGPGQACWPGPLGRRGLCEEQGARAARGHQDAQKRSYPPLRPFLAPARPLLLFLTAVLARPQGVAVARLRAGAGGGCKGGQGGQEEEGGAERHCFFLASESA